MAKGELLKEFWKSYCAMANTNGGIILLSLTGNGRGAVYRFSQVPATSPDDVFGQESPLSGGGSSTISEARKFQKRDEEGRRRITRRSANCPLLCLPS